MERKPPPADHGTAAKSTREEAAHLTAVRKTLIDPVPAVLPGGGARFEVASFHAFQNAEQAKG